MHERIKGTALYNASIKLVLTCKQNVKQKNKQKKITQAEKNAALSYKIKPAVCMNLCTFCMPKINVTHKLADFKW